MTDEPLSIVADVAEFNPAAVEPPGVAELRATHDAVREELIRLREERDRINARIKTLVAHEVLLRRAVAVFDKGA